MQNNDGFGEFNGTFDFTNPTNKERKYLWNNKEYTFPPMSTVPLIILGEPLENIQEIRKRFAYRMAEERFYESKDYEKMKKMGQGLPPTFDAKILEPFIEECLKPLPKARAGIKTKNNSIDERSFKATKALSERDNPSMIFAEENKNPPVLGQMSDK